MNMHRGREAMKHHNEFSAEATPVLELIHSPLFSELTWNATAEALRANGLPAFTPSMKGVFDGSPPYYSRLVSTVLDQIEQHRGRRDVILVGHSGAGALLPAISHRVTGRTVGTIFVDAILPHPGHSWFDSASETLCQQLRELTSGGRLPPWHRWFPPNTAEALLPTAESRRQFFTGLPEAPLSYFEERAPRGEDVEPSGSAYLRLTDAYEEAAREAEHRGWLVAHHPAHHLAILTSPETIAASLVGLTRALLEN